MSLLELANHSTKDNAIGTPGALQIEATESRMSMVDRFEHGLAKVPTGVLFGAGFVGGVMAVAPGRIGWFGKALSLGLAAGVTSDLALKVTGLSKSNQSMKQTFFRDGTTLATMAIGIFTGRAAGLSELAENSEELDDARRSGRVVSISKGAGFRPAELSAQNAVGVAARRLHGSSRLFDSDRIFADEAVGGLTRYEGLGGVTVNSENVVARAQNAGREPFLTPEARSAAARLNRGAEDITGSRGKLLVMPERVGASHMIEESDMQKFSPDKQAEIRKEIERMASNGYPKRFLELDPTNGTVIYNAHAHENAIELGLEE